MNNRELDFAYKVRAGLNESIEQLPSEPAKRLAAARRAALLRKKADAPIRVFVTPKQLAGHIGNFVSSPVSWVVRMGLVIPLLVAAIGLVSIYHVEEEHRIQETADIDADVLADELPLSAYLDHGFNAYLDKQRAE
jgi:hypothetical protein